MRAIREYRIGSSLDRCLHEWAVFLSGKTLHAEHQLPGGGRLTVAISPVGVAAEHDGRCVITIGTEPDIAPRAEAVRDGEPAVEAIRRLQEALLDFPISLVEVRPGGCERRELRSRSRR